MASLIVFIFCFFIVAYTCVGYPILLAFLAKFFGKRRQMEPIKPSVSFLMAFHNEEGNLERRLTELCALLETSQLSGEILAISDGSTDRSAEIARSFSARGVKLLEQIPNQGKAAALTLGAKHATGDLLIFCDARQRWADDALLRLVENFADPAVGACSGDLVLETASGVLAGVGLYWRFEKWMRKTESRLHAQVGVTGAISACRRELFPEGGIPTGTLLDDVYWPLTIALRGYRVVHDERAKAFDRLPERSRDEFRRKVRTLAGNYQLMALLPNSLLPWRNPVWWQWISHKLLRLAIPWALLGMLASSFFLPEPWGFWLVLLQGLAYALGLAAMWEPVGKRFKILGAGASFLVLNAAAFFGFWVWLLGRSGQAWRKVDYSSPAAE